MIASMNACDKQFFESVIKIVDACEGDKLMPFIKKIIIAFSSQEYFEKVVK